MHPSRSIQQYKRSVIWNAWFVLTAIFIAVMVLTGWQADIEFFRRPFSGQVAMNPATALAFILAGVSFFLLRSARIPAFARHTGLGLAFLVIMIGVAKIFELITDINIGFDRLLFAEKLENERFGQQPNRMAPITAMNFVITGLSLMLLRFENPLKKILSQYGALLLVLVNLLVIIGYLYDERSFYTLHMQTPISLPAAVNFLMIALAVLLVHPHDGFMKEFTTGKTGGYTFRLLLPATVIIPVGLGLLRLYGQRSGWYTNEAGTGIFVITIVIIFFAIVWYTTILLNRRDALKELSEKALLESESQVQAIFRGAPDAVIVIDEEGRIVQWNQKSEILFGWQAQEVMGKPMADLIIPDRYRDAHRKGLHQFVKTGKSSIGNKTLRLSGLKKDGTEVDLSLSIAPVMLQNKYLFIGFIRDITEQKKMEDQIRKFNEDLEQQVQEKTAALTSIFERISDGFIALDKNFCYTYVNKKTGELVRRDPKSLIGKNVWNIFPDAVGSDSYKAFNKAMEEQVYVSNTDYYPPLDLWQENHIYPSPEGISVFIRDITQRKKAELALKESEEKYRLLFERSPLPMWVYELDTFRIISVNEAAVHHYGYTEEEFLRMTVYDIRPESEHARFKAYFGEKKPGLRSTGIWKHKKKDGTIIDVEVNSHDISFNGIDCRLVLANDVTEKLKTEKALAESENRLRTIVQTEPECVKLLGSECEVLEMNPAGLVMIEADDISQVMGKSVLQLVSPAYQKAFSKMVKDVFAGKSVSLEFEMHGLKGTPRWLETHAVPLKDPDGTIQSLLGVTRDVTERKNIEFQIRHTTEELRRLASHLQRVREQERISIAREIHDELGQQLTVLKMDISQLKKKLPPGDEMLLERVNQLLATVDGTVKTVRRISSDLRPGILDDLGLEAAMEWYVQEFERRSGIKTNLQSAISGIHLSTEMSTGLYRIFQESLTNVARHANATEVNINLRIDGSDLLMLINDNGKGFLQSEIENKKTLGILGMRERALMMGGEYLIESTPGKGSVTRIRVPVGSRN